MFLCVRGKQCACALQIQQTGPFICLYSVYSNLAVLPLPSVCVGGKSKDEGLFYEQDLMKRG